MADVKTQEALVERLFRSLIGAMDLLHVYVGDELGLYRALAAAGPLTSGDLAKRCEIHERYAREWLEQQAVAVTGLDLDPESVSDASRNAEAAGVAGRVLFEVRDAADPVLGASFDLVCAFETIHDMCDPVGALRAMRSLRAPGGTVLVADERVADTFTVDVDDAERFQWGFSALHCLPTAMTSPPAAGTGTIMRTPTFRRYAVEAGFADVEVLPIDNDFWRFYRLVD